MKGKSRTVDDRLAAVYSGESKLAGIRVHPFAAHVGEPEWPRWVLLGSATIPVITGVIAVFQRWSEYGSWWPYAAIAAFAVSPWIVEGVWRPIPKAVSSAIVVAGVLLLELDYTQVDVVPFLLVFLVAEMTARGTRAGGLLLAAIGSAIMITYEVQGGDGLFIWVFGIWMGWAAGAMMQSLMALTLDLQEAQAGLSEKAATDERQRIAREVHDVIAHSMTVTMLHVTGARMALNRGDAAEAVEALEEAERLGRQALSDIRRTVGLLAPDGTSAGPPMPKASELPGLVDGFAHAGLAIDFEVDGDLERVPEATGLAAYRIVQESLANAAKHAPGEAVSVGVMVGGDVSIRVHNAVGNGVAPSRDGLGLRGMEQRATSLGGTFAAGPDEDGWTVSATLPNA